MGKNMGKRIRFSEKSDFPPYTFGGKFTWGKKGIWKIIFFWEENIHPMLIYIYYFIFYLYLYFIYTFQPLLVDMSEQVDDVSGAQAQLILKLSQTQSKHKLREHVKKFAIFTFIK